MHIVNWSTEKCVGNRGNGEDEGFWAAGKNEAKPTLPVDFALKGS